MAISWNLDLSLFQNSERRLKTEMYWVVGIPLMIYLVGNSQEEKKQDSVLAKKSSSIFSKYIR